MPPSNEEERGRHRGTPRGPPGGGGCERRRSPRAPPAWPPRTTVQARRSSPKPGAGSLCPLCPGCALGLDPQDATTGEAGDRVHETSVSLSSQL